MILYDGIIYSLQRNGGISVLYNELLSRLSEASCNYSVISYGHSVEFPGKKNIVRAPRLAERYRSVNYERADIFHSTYYRLPDSSSIGLSKVITTVHDYTYERYIGGLKRQVHSWQKNRAINKSDKIICVSESTKNDALEFSGVSEDRIEVIPNGVSADYFSIPGMVLSDLPQAIFVGARQGYKNFDSVVKAVSLFKDLVLVCVGGGGFDKKELAFLDENLPGRYRHAGFLTNAELNVEYNKAICLIYPSLYEGFGIPVLEAMSAGCPVIAVDASSIPEVAGDAAHLIERGTVEEIEAGISALMSDDYRQSLISKGFIQADKFSWDITYKKTMALYEQVLGKKLA